MAALAHGLPIISTEPSSPISCLRDGETIRLVPAGNAMALSRAAEALWRDPETRARLSVSAKALSERFSWSQIAEQTLEVLHAAARSA